MIAWLEKHLLITADIVQLVLPFLLELRAIPAMLKIPKNELIPCPGDAAFLLVTQTAVEYVEMPMLEGGDQADDYVVETSTGGTAAAAADASGTAASPAAQRLRIVSRPQAGNGQSYFGKLHKWAGRKAGGFGRPAGFHGKGSWAQHAHRPISTELEQHGTTFVG